MGTEDKRYSGAVNILMIIRLEHSPFFTSFSALLLLDEQSSLSVKMWCTLATVLYNMMAKRP